MSQPDAFVGRQTVERDVADHRHMAGLAALLDHDAPPWAPGVLPPLGHWLCFPPLARQSRIGPDGHPRRTADGLLPAVDLPRRMWAGSRIRFLREIALGSAMTRTSTLVAARAKTGRSGDLLFCTLRHDIAIEAGEVAITEEQDIVFREAARPGTPIRPAGDAVPDAAVREVVPDATMLFRYSALTFNAHRIHYDRDYCRNEEGYPGLVVHGPLVATLMLDTLLREHPGLAIRSYEFTGVSPTFENETLRLGFAMYSGGVKLHAAGPLGTAAVATVGLIPDGTR